jgi:hypothetical protein
LLSSSCHQAPLSTLDKAVEHKEGDTSQQKYGKDDQHVINGVVCHVVDLVFCGGVHIERVRTCIMGYLSEGGGDVNIIVGRVVIVFILAHHRSIVTIDIERKFMATRTFDHGEDRRGANTKLVHKEHVPRNHSKVVTDDSSIGFKAVKDWNDNKCFNCLFMRFSVVPL